MFENQRQLVLDVPQEVGNLINAHCVSSAHNIHNTYYTNYRPLVIDIDNHVWAVVEVSSDRNFGPACIVGFREPAKACMHCLLSAQLNLCARVSGPTFMRIHLFSVRSPIGEVCFIITPFFSPTAPDHLMVNVVTIFLWLFRSAVRSAFGIFPFIFFRSLPHWRGVVPS